MKISDQLKAISDQLGLAQSITALPVASVRYSNFVGQLRLGHPLTADS